ncbi:MAG: GspH/FimT family pseudopilin [Limisphaerales bacterium]
MISGTGPRTEPQAERRDGFTLLELILVLALLAIAVSIVTPRLSGFASGRAFDSETRRLLALTHAARSRAISEGRPIVLWIDTTAGTYGLRQDGPVANVDTNALEFTLAPGITAAFDAAEALAGQTTTSRRPQVPPLPNAVTVGPLQILPGIRMMPDGSVDESSPQSIRITNTDGTALWLVQGSDRRHYELRPANL